MVEQFNNFETKRKRESDAYQAGLNAAGHTESPAQANATFGGFSKVALRNGELEFTPLE